MKALGRLAVVLVFMMALAPLACDSDNGSSGPPVDEPDVPGAPDVVAPDDANGGGEPDTDPGGCVPDCAGKQCGSDGCGGACPPGCGEGFLCSAEGLCVCQRSCVTDEGDEKECGSDGCMGSCGVCRFGTICSPDFKCVPGGDLSCPTFFVCLEACEDSADPVACASDCEDAVLETERALATTVAACLDANCDECTDLECLQVCGRQECGQDFVECFSGDQICFQVFACVSGCVMTHTWGTPEYASCRIDCLALGTPDAQELYLELEECIDTYCDRLDTATFEACERSARGRECTTQSAKCPNL